MGSHVTRFEIADAPADASRFSVEDPDALARSAKPTQFENERQPNRQPGVTRSLLSEVGDAIKSAPNMVRGMFDPATTARRAGALFEHDQDRAATRSPVYRAVADVGEAGGVNAPGMEHDADVGNRRGIIGKATGDALMLAGPAAADMGLTAAKGRFPNYKAPEPRPFNWDKAVNKTTLGGALDLMSPNPTVGKAAMTAGAGLATEAVPWLANKVARSKPVVDFMTKRPADKGPVPERVPLWKQAEKVGKSEYNPQGEPSAAAGPLSREATPTEPSASKPVGDTGVEPMAKSKPVDKGVDMSRRNFLKKGGQAVVGAAASGAVKGPLSVPEGITGVGASTAADAGEAMQVGKRIGRLSKSLQQEIENDNYETTSIDGDVFNGVIDHIATLAEKAKTLPEIEKAEQLYDTLINHSFSDGLSTNAATEALRNVMIDQHGLDIKPIVQQHMNDIWGPGEFEWDRAMADHEQSAVESTKRAEEFNSKKSVEKAEQPKKLAQDMTETQAAQGPGRRTTDFNIGGMADPFAPTSAAQSPEFDFARPGNGKPTPPNLPKLKGGNLPIPDAQKDAFQRFVKSKGKEGPLARQAKKPAPKAEPLYHGTSEQNLESIQQHGLDINKSQSFENAEGDDAEETDADARRVLHMGHDPSTAKAFTPGGRGYSGPGPGVILKIDPTGLPIIEDRGEFARSESSIPPDRISVHQRFPNIFADNLDDQAVKQEIEQRTQVRPKEPGRKGKAELAEEFKRGKKK